jgi:hypothetical protein
MNWAVSVGSSVKCILCEGGRFNSGAGNAYCKDCSAGMYRSGGGAPQPGEETAAAAGSAEEDAEEVDGEEVGDDVGIDTKVCFECPLGWISAKASVKCQLCEAGRFSNVVGKECTDCTIGQHRPRKFDNGTNTAATHCLLCPHGYSSLEQGVTRCTPLPPGSYDLHKNGSVHQCEPGFTCAGVDNDREPCLSGTYTSGIGSISCIACPPGKFSPLNGAFTCKSCPHGFLQSTPGNNHCVQVEKGKIVATGGSASVTVPVGSKICTDVNASNHCDECEDCAFLACSPGTIGTAPPSTLCEMCPVGFSSVSAAIECQACSKGRFNNVTGGLCEECEMHTFQEQSQVASINCSNCPTGFNQDKKGASVCLSKEWRYATDCKLFLQVLNDTGVERIEYECIPCPFGGNCTIHTTLTKLEPEDGFQRLTFDKYGFGQCPVAAACSAKYVDNGGCKDGHNSEASELCAQCHVGYAMQSGRGELCQKCPPALVTGALMFGVVVVVVMLFAFLVWDNLDGGKAMIPRPIKDDDDGDNWDDEDEDKDIVLSTTEMPFHSIVIRAVSSYLQIAGLLLKFQLSLPRSVQTLITIENSASSLSEPLLLFDCAIFVRADGAVFLLKQLASVWFIPLVAVVLLALFWLVVGKCCLKSKEDDASAVTGLDGFVSSLMILFYTLFPSVVNRIALTFSCQVYGYGELQRTLLTESLSIQCYSFAHIAIVTAVGIPGILLFVVIIPTLIALTLMRQRRKLKLYPSQKHYESKWTLRFGFMFAGYSEGYEWWEAVVMMRKCCFVILAIFLRQYGAASQVVAASLVLVAALSAQLQNMPYQNIHHDMIETVGLQVCILQLLTVSIVMWWLSCGVCVFVFFFVLAILYIPFLHVCFVRLSFRLCCVI